MIMMWFPVKSKYKSSNLNSAPSERTGDKSNHYPPSSISAPAFARRALAASWDIPGHRKPAGQAGRLLQSPFSPDGNWLALAMASGKGRDIYVYDWRHDMMPRLTLFSVPVGRFIPYMLVYVDARKVSDFGGNPCNCDHPNCAPS